MLTLISYDIVENKRRRKVMELLEGYGARVQDSVFECRLSGPELAAVGREVLTIIDRATDSVRYYPLDAAAAQRILIHGVGQVTPEPTHYLV